MTVFLDDDDIKTLTGFSIKKKQVEQLRKMGIPFFLNGCGKPVVARSAIDGGVNTGKSKTGWTPSILKSHGNAA